VVRLSQLYLVWQDILPRVDEAEEDAANSELSVREIGWIVNVNKPGSTLPHAPSGHGYDHHQVVKEAF
jgi:hypothetical protein